jgi:GNAT superfamily N-acetyltransferase
MPASPQLEGMPITESPLDVGHLVAGELDNPVWSALSGQHRDLAGRVGDLAWYPPAIAPFVAISNNHILPNLESAHALGLASPAYFVGACPERLPRRWRVISSSHILQLFPTEDVPLQGEDAGMALGAADANAMRALTQIAFPDFFRERTRELGLYLGIYEGEQLIAMAGERLALTGLTEISGVCTHPDYGGRGYARRLTRALLSLHRRRGVRSFLHVSEGNDAARRLYESMGFVERASLRMCKVERLAEPA